MNLYLAIVLIVVAFFVGMFFGKRNPKDVQIVQDIGDKVIDKTKETISGFKK